MKIAVLFSGDMESLSLGGIDRYLKSLVSFFEDKEITIFGTGRAGVIKTGKKYKRKYNGKTYYFGADGKEYKDQFYNNWGHTYYFQADGSRLDNGF